MTSAGGVFYDPGGPVCSTLSKNVMDREEGGPNKCSC